MNKYQKILLMVSAVVFIVALLTSPKVCYLGQGVLMKSTKYSKEYAPIVDIRTASVRGIAVLGAMALLYFALRSKR